jgi:hypothetical protein
MDGSGSGRVVAAVSIRGIDGLRNWAHWTVGKQIFFCSLYLMKHD